MVPPAGLIIIHRVNTIESLLSVPHEFGVEIDVRGMGDRLLLSHDPLTDKGAYDELEPYLDAFKHAFIIFNTKEAGYEDRIIKAAESRGIDYFLLDVEFPYLFRASRNGVRKIAVRYSEAEPIENVLAQIENGKPLVDWVWVDTVTRLPIDSTVAKQLTPFKTCLVCPSRFGRTDDIESYCKQMDDAGFKPTAVMTDLSLAPQWTRWYRSRT
ncbi:MAG: hypothetical protein ABIH41_07495 [Nanoarchaeota archaeon]